MAPPQPTQMQSPQSFSIPSTRNIIQVPPSNLMREPRLVAPVVAPFEPSTYSLPTSESETESNLVRRSTRERNDIDRFGYDSTHLQRRGRSRSERSQRSKLGSSRKKKE